jgi:hypothetical protein
MEMGIMRFLADWLADSIRFGLALTMALGAMQIPALAQSYRAALTQVAEAGQRDIADRQRIAREYYRLPPDALPGMVLDALRRSEPANAAGLVASAEQAALLRATAERLDRTSPITRPLVALWDGLTDDRAGKPAILRRAWQDLVPAVLLSAAPASYGLGGLIIGLLLARLLIAPLVTGRARHA